MSETQAAGQQDSQEPEGQLLFRRVLLDVAPPRTAHSFGWSRVNEEFLLEVGYIDLFAASQLIQRAKSGEEVADRNLDWFITDRFTLSMEAARRLVQIADSLRLELDRMKEKGKE